MEQARRPHWRAATAAALSCVVSERLLCAWYCRISANAISYSPAPEVAGHITVAAGFKGTVRVSQCCLIAVRLLS